MLVYLSRNEQELQVASKCLGSQLCISSMTISARSNRMYMMHENDSKMFRGLFRRGQKYAHCHTNHFRVMQCISAVEMCLKGLNRDFSMFERIPDSFSFISRASEAHYDESWLLLSAHMSTQIWKYFRDMNLVL